MVVTYGRANITLLIKILRGRVYTNISALRGVTHSPYLSGGFRVRTGRDLKVSVASEVVSMFL